MRLSLAQAIKQLQSGNVIAIPTETVYGLAASLHQVEAIHQIFSLKNRPLTNPLIIHTVDRRSLGAYVSDYPPDFEALAQTFWPGPMTCILPVNPASVPECARAGLPTVGFRIPSLTLTQTLLHATGPIVMPSANLSGRPSATSPEHVEEDFGLDFPLLDGGPCPCGVESTILFYRETEWIILRLGAIAPELFQPILGYEPLVIAPRSEEKPLCPGQLFRHYAPRARLFIGELAKFPDVLFVLGFQERKYAGKRVIVLGSLEDAEGVAENLYHALRQLDQEGASQAWIDMKFPRHGLWQTIAERLTRATARA